MVWSTNELQEILQWVNDADRARARKGEDAEQEAVPSHINLPVSQAQPPADTNSWASSDPPGSWAKHIEEDTTRKHVDPPDSWAKHIEETLPANMFNNSAIAAAL